MMENSKITEFGLLWKKLIQTEEVCKLIQASPNVTSEAFMVQVLGHCMKKSMLIFNYQINF